MGAGTNVPARSLVCPCGRTLGTISRKRDQHGNPYDKLKLNHNVERVGRVAERGFVTR